MTFHFFFSLENLPHSSIIHEKSFKTGEFLLEKTRPIRKPFYFIRHGETDVNANAAIKRVDYDLPLNNKGRNQARLAHDLIKTIPIASVCFSPIQRAVETKEILASSLNLEEYESEDLSECKASTWTKMVQLEKDKNLSAYPEVEAFLKRAYRGLQFALQKDKTTLLVSHGGIHWALCYYLAIKNHPWKIGNCQLVHFHPVGKLDWKAEIINKN